MEYLKFSTNWNNKLGCKVFSSLRLANAKYQPGKVFDVAIKNKTGDLDIAGSIYRQLGQATILLVKTIQVKDLTNGMCLVDTGYDRNETRAILFRMYKNLSGGFSDQTSMVFILFKWLKEPYQEIKKPQTNSDLQPNVC